MSDAEVIRTDDEGYDDGSNEDSSVEDKSLEELFKDINDEGIDDQESDYESASYSDEGLLKDIVPFDDSASESEQLLPSTDYFRSSQIDERALFTPKKVCAREGHTHEQTAIGNEKPNSYLIKTMTFLIKKAHEGLNAIGSRFQPAFSAVHLLVIFCKQVPLTSLLSTIKQENEDDFKHEDPQFFSEGNVIKLLVNLGYRCTSLITDFSSPVLDSLNKDISLLFADDFSFGDPKIRSVFDTLAKECSNKEKLEVMKIGGDELLAALSTRLAGDPAYASLINTYLAECRKTLITKRTDRRVERVVRKNRNERFVSSKNERKREKKEEVVARTVTSKE